MSTSNQRLFTRADAANTGQFTGADWALFLSVSMIWGASFLLIAYALEGLTPGMVTLGRAVCGAAVIQAIGRVRGDDVRIARDDRLRFVVLSVVWVAFPFVLFPIAQGYINSAVTGLLNGAVPILAALVSTAFLRRAPQGIQLVGIGVGFAGVILISFGSAGGDDSAVRGIAMVLAATVCYGIGLNIAAPLQNRYGAIPTISRVLTMAALWVAPYGLWNFGDNEWKLRSVAAVIVLGMVGTGAAYAIMATLVGRVGPIRASFITYLIPVVSLLLGVVFRDDSVTRLALVGAALTLAGALLASRRQHGA